MSSLTKRITIFPHKVFLYSALLVGKMAKQIKKKSKKINKCSETQTKFSRMQLQNVKSAKYSIDSRNRLSDFVKKCKQKLSVPKHFSRKQKEITICSPHFLTIINR